MMTTTILLVVVKQTRVRVRWHMFWHAQLVDTQAIRTCPLSTSSQTICRP